MRDDAAAEYSPDALMDEHHPFADDSGAFDAHEPFPWPPVEGESAIAALGRTWREVMTAPTSFFRRMPPHPLRAAILYFLVIGIVASGIQLFWNMIALMLFGPAAEGSLRSFFLPTSAGDALLTFLFAPIVMVCALFIGTAITHGLLRLMRGGDGGYGTSVRVFCYVESPHLLVIIPVFGMFLAMLWSFVLAVIGLREAHRTTTAKALLALLLPVAIIFFMVLMLVVVTVMGAAMLAS